MKKIIKFLLYIILLIIISCGATEEVILEEPETIIIPEQITTEIKYIHNDPFYPMKDKIEDLEFKIDQLRAQVLEYESSLHAPTLNSELLKLIKSPQMQHEIIMDNGTIIQGKIIQENSEILILKTRIGQLKLDKTLIQSINELMPLSPNFIFDEKTIEEKLSSSNKSFNGEILNNGGRRGDFVRVIYKLWEPTDTIPSIIDSIFISGNNISYTNGIISDACLNPGEKGKFNISINVPDSVDISHWTKEIKFDLYE